MPELLREKRLAVYALRHSPEVIGIELDSNGWVPVRDFLKAMSSVGKKISIDDLNEIVSSDDKGRLELSSNRQKIRAVHGHSVHVDFTKDASQPPDVLYHGTSTARISSILKSGLQSMRRQYVHLSEDEETAFDVGSRHGDSVVILPVESGRMFESGQKFVKSSSGIWLVRQVPSDFIRIDQAIYKNKGDYHGYDR